MLPLQVKFNFRCTNLNEGRWRPRVPSPWTSDPDEDVFVYQQECLLAEANEEVLLIQVVCGQTSIRRVERFVNEGLSTRWFSVPLLDQSSGNNADKLERNAQIDLRRRPERVSTRFFDKSV